MAMGYPGTSGWSMVDGGVDWGWQMNARARLAG